MNEATMRIISGISTWQDLAQFRENVLTRGALSSEIVEALQTQGLQLSREMVAQRTGLELSSLSAAEKKIVAAVSEYVAIKTTEGSHAQRTLNQLRTRGLIGAAEAAVSRNRPSAGFRALEEAERKELSYEQIVVDHPEEFTHRAVWYARRQLGMQNDDPRPPVEEAGSVQARTSSLIQWFKEGAAANGGLIPSFTNEEAAAVAGFTDMRSQGRVQGNLQSRIDFACYLKNVPPLGLAADKPFAKAWQPASTWSFPVQAMQFAARNREWTNEEFDGILRETERLPSQAHLIWNHAFEKEDARVKGWAQGFSIDAPDDQAGEPETKKPRNAIWSRDELILALDLYVKHEGNPPSHTSKEVEELSQVLNELGGVLGQRRSETYRNANGVYMKLMNFRRWDPHFSDDGKKGLSRGNKDEESVWNQFAHDPARLSKVAALIRAGIDEHAGDADIAGPDEAGIVEAEEGRVVTRLHRFRERDRRLVAEAKARALKEHGRLFCVACGFDFSRSYGAAGEGIIDVHHTKPIHTMQPGEKTKLSDLELLCANCHRMVHSKRQWLLIDELKSQLEGATTVLAAPEQR